MKRTFLICGLLSLCLTGCMNAGEVSQSDAEKNAQAFSKDAYEQAMIKAGKGAELEEAKKREAESLRGGQ